MLGPLNKAWMYLGIFLGLIITPFIMGFIFFIIISPVSIITRVFGRDELQIKKNLLPSLWKIRNRVQESPSSFKNQF